MGEGWGGRGECGVVRWGRGRGVCYYLLACLACVARAACYPGEGALPFVEDGLDGGHCDLLEEYVEVGWKECIGACVQT